MRQKELRIALVCYGGVSLAVYMHGVTKEVWHLVRASRDFLGGVKPEQSSSSHRVYHDLLRRIAADKGLRVRVLCDVAAGASAGGLNALFLAEAIHSGGSIEPLTRLWLERADVDQLLAPEARRWRFAKWWALPLVWWMLRRPGNAVSHSVAPETREEVRRKLSRLIRSRWFKPPFSGIGFSRMLAEALDAMHAGGSRAPLLPPGHPLDLFVTATDFGGHRERLRLNSPRSIEESEHRLPLGFHAEVPAASGKPLAPLPELVMAGRATASFPGAFPPVQVAEIDALAAERAEPWPGRDAYLRRIMPEHVRRGDVGSVALIDGSVLNNRPFSEAMAAIPDRPAQREVDRRFVYIDPHPSRADDAELTAEAPGWFTTIFGAMSAIPREQPVRDNLEAIERRSRELIRLRGIVEGLRPEVEATVESLFGRTLFLNRPTEARMEAWRRKAQKAAAENAGFAYSGYAQVKFVAIVDELAATIHAAAPELELPSPEAIAARLMRHLSEAGLTDFTAPRGSGASNDAIAFFRAHDIGFRIRRLRLLARRLTDDRGDDGGNKVDDGTAREAARAAVFEALALFFEREPASALGSGFAVLARRVFDDPGAVLDAIARQRALPEADLAVEARLVAAMKALPQQLRRQMLLTYLGFPFYDTVTLPLLRGEGLNEFDPAKVDRISPEDARTLDEGESSVLRGTEFYNFGAFFSRAYRENDYLWGRLHGAERMIDLVASTLPPADALDAGAVLAAKRAAFAAICDEEEGRLLADPALVARVRAKIATLGAHEGPSR